MAIVQPIRIRETPVQVKVNGAFKRGTFTKIMDLKIDFDQDMPKKQYHGDGTAVADLDIKGVNFSFKTEVSDHGWHEVLELIRDAAQNGKPMPDIVIIITHNYRDGLGTSRSLTLHGDLVMMGSIDYQNYVGISWSGSCSFMSGV